MNYQPEGEATVTERRDYRKLFRGTLLLTIIAVLFFGAYYYYMNYYRYRNLAPTGNDALDSYGTDNANATDLVGKLYFAVATVETSDTVSTPSVYQYDVVGKFSDLKTHQNLRGYIALDTNTALVIASNSQNENDQTWQPHLYNAATEILTELPNVKGFYVRDLAVSPDGLRYAYSYRTAEVKEGGMSDLSGWNIAVHTMNTDEVEIIEGAAEPEWLSGSDTLVYMKTDGLFTYTFGFKETALFTDAYAPYDLNSDYSISAGAQKMVITNQLPLTQIVAVLDITKDETQKLIVTEVARVVSESIVYSNPVLDVAGGAYAVLATTLAAKNTEEPAGLTVIEAQVIEIRDVTGKDVRDTVAVPADITGDVTLTNWSAE